MYSTLKKKLFLILFIISLSGLAVSAYQSKFITLGLIAFSNFEEIQHNVYVSPDTTKEQKQKLLTLIGEGERRLEKTFKKYTAQPTIIASFNNEAMQTYSKNSYASATFFPNKVYITIGKNGFNIDVISHELAHAELFSRTGYFKRLLQIPIWFDEGIAMQFDDREKYNHPPKAESDLSQLKYGRQFYKGNSETLTKHYAIAKDEVGRWLGYLKKNTLYDFLDEIKQGKDFDDLYQAYKQSSTKEVPKTIID